MKKEPYWKIFKDYHIYYNTVIGRFFKWKKKRKNDKKFNRKKIYQCPECKEWFRLKMSLDTHKCNTDFKVRRNV
ncbi:hypothetical protein LCGC14_0461920 [marine sediment metagenome]|uniref:C2H2-type domain-containing protein n=1 Tax=marine sediment metagenome TaxID=412755 RepID=A0A0F9VNJ1_9ZZZZ